MTVLTSSVAQTGAHNSMQLTTLRPKPGEEERVCVTEPFSEGSTTNRLGKHACVICYDRHGDHVMVPCGHGGYCRSCAKKMCSGKAPPYSHTHGHMCPLCMTPVDAVVKVSLDTPKGQSCAAVCSMKCQLMPASTVDIVPRP